MGNRRIPVRLQKNLFQVFRSEPARGGIDGGRSRRRVGKGLWRDESKFFHGFGDFSGRVGQEGADVWNFGRQSRGLGKRNSFRESFCAPDGLFERDEALLRMVGADVGEYFPHGFGGERRRRGGDCRRRRGIWNGNRWARDSRRYARDECLRRLDGRHGQYRAHGNAHCESYRRGVLFDPEGTEQPVNREKRARTGHSCPYGSDSSDDGERSRRRGDGASGHKREPDGQADFRRLLPNFAQAFGFGKRGIGFRFFGGLADWGNGRSDGTREIRKSSWGGHGVKSHGYALEPIPNRCENPRKIPEIFQRTADDGTSSPSLPKRV